MKHNEFMWLEEKCPKCQSELMLQKTSWSDMSGDLHYVFCEPCHCKGNGANDKETALEVLQVFLQPFDGVCVQMVSWLVEHECVRVREEDTRQLDASSLTPGECAQRALEGFLTQA